MLSACAAQSQTTWRPTVDTYGSSRAQYLSRDTEECRSLAMSASGSTGEQAARGAIGGGLLGAAAGTAIGAATGNIGRGAAIGATVGAVGAGTSRAAQSNADFQRAFNNCMRNRGHRVIN
jgi:outer membrane lipoprotein SlyB